MTTRSSQPGGSKRRSRRWCFTINNPSENDDPQRWDGYVYLIWQKERGELGTVHLQGFVVWDNARTLSYCRCKSSRAHWEIARGTLEQNKKYCSKEEGREDGPWIRGHEPRPGTRSDILEATAMIDEGYDLREIALSHPDTYVRYHNGLKSYRLETASDRAGQPNIIILWGPSGCGKSRLVRDTFPGAYRKPKKEQGGDWWDGYHTQDAVVFDDFYSWISYDQILRILDWYPLLVKISGGYVRLIANTFVFTSNQDPMDWYRGGHNGRPERDRSALWRRFKDFGLVLKWGLVGRRNQSGSMTYTNDWVPDNRFREMDL